MAEQPKRKMPKDPNQLAAKIVEMTTGQPTIQPVPDKEKDPSHEKQDEAKERKED